MVGGSAAAESRSSKRPPLVRKLLRTGARVSALKETALVAKLEGRELLLSGKEKNLPLCQERDWTYARWKYLWCSS